MATTALKIAFDATTGKRAGDINPRDAGLPTISGRASQYLAAENSYEIRLITDGRPIDQYRNLAGVTVLKGATAINAELAALEQAQPPAYKIDESVVLAALQDDTHPEWGDLTRLAGKNLRDEAAALYADGVPGVTETRVNIPRV